MARTLKFTIPGPPVSSPRMTRSDKWKKRPCVMRARAWADLARLSAKEQVGTLPHPKTIRSLSWVAYFAPPASWSEKRKRAALGKRHMSKPDKDNLEKEILDSLFEDDSAISDGASSKRWGLPPRVEITIELEPTIEEQASAKKTRTCPECHAQTDGGVHKTPSGRQCDMVTTRRGGWRQLGVYDG